MIKIGAYDAKRKFSSLLHKVEKGEAFIITNRGREVARILPMPEKRKRPIRQVIEEILAIETETDCSQLSTEELRQEGRR